MDERVELLLRQHSPVFCIDIGGMTQNAILARNGQSPESWPRFSFPSPAAQVAQRILELTLLKLNIWLYGSEMGGGFVPALRQHLKMGLKVSATAAAAKSIHNDLNVVQNMDVQIVEVCPRGFVPVYCADFDKRFWNAMLQITALPLPHLILAAVQDHGGNAGGSRQNRLDKWESLLMANPDPVYWIHEEAPSGMSRMAALQGQTGGPVADTAACAILGALSVPDVFLRSCREGVTLLNLGSVHTIGALVHKGRVCAIYEHHTDKQDIKILMDNLEQFKLRWLPREKVQNEGGHGTVYLPPDENGESFDPVYVTGPKRQLLADYGMTLIPHDDMLHAGCFGLLYGWARANAKL